MSVLFVGVVFIVSSLVILYIDNYMFGDLNIVRFIYLVLIFVVSMVLWCGILMQAEACIRIPHHPSRTTP
jgi:NADH:ubiquinone oxidoreductase subunit 5 (subunit L)/multisubunit Na+/H+ antiporter MnhA subunit